MQLVDLNKASHKFLGLFGQRNRLRKFPFSVSRFAPFSIFSQGVHKGVSREGAARISGGFDAIRETRPCFGSYSQSD
jgi:hypothetical protein